MVYWDDGHMGSGWGVVMVISMLLFWALLAVAIVWAVRSTRAPRTPMPPSTPSGGTGSAEQILAERLARGEIEPEDYQTRLTALKSAR